MSSGIYIHFPFCEIRCGYCDFYTLTGQGRKIPAYLEALEREIDLYSALPAWQQLEFTTLYIGGGTPSILSPGQIGEIIEHARAHFNFASNSEITLETNPNTVDFAKLADLRNAGINRLSLGVQSFNTDELQFLDRDHTVEQSRNAVNAARRAGFDNISFDLIYSLPEQQPESWQQTLKQAIELDPQHISAYNLTYEKGTPLAKQLSKGRIIPTSEELQRSQQLLVMDFLPGHGLEQYEISNFALPGFHSQHNLKYWDGSPYLGLGPSSHSYLSNRRFWNINSITGYIEILNQGTLPVAGDEFLSQNEIEFECVYLGLRQRRGIHLLSFAARTGVSFFQRFAKVLQKFFPADFDSTTSQSELVDGVSSIVGEFLQIENGCLRLTRNGILVCDAICAEFV